MKKTKVQILTERRAKLERIEMQLEKLGLGEIAYQVYEEETKLTEQIDKLILGE